MFDGRGASLLAVRRGDDGIVGELPSFGGSREGGADIDDGGGEGFDPPDALRAVYRKGQASGILGA